MITVLKLLNKIKCDKNSKGEYKLEYFDRIKNRLITIEFEEIKEINKFSMILEDKEIPLHRIRKVYKDNLLIWKREK